MAMSTRQIAMGSTVIGVLAGLGLYFATRSVNRRKHTETLRDDSLRDSFPASDTPATQDFSIPVNRQ
jgi:hypothetical protein